MRIYEIVIAMVKSVCALSRKVDKHDGDLARQMRRACVSVALNMNEGWHSLAGNRRARFYSAMGSARETLTSLEISVACDYLTDDDIAVDRDRLDHIVAVNWKLAHR